jgi:uncharacterized protein YyaL (SSP411 family)
MIAAMAQAGVVFEREDWVAAAIRAFDYVVMTMSVRGRLMHSIRRSTKRGAGMLDDYAQMARAALMLFEISGEQKYLEHAEAWVATLDAHFWDDANGGYFFTADDAEGLIVRTRAAHDNATPSGNGTMAGVLARLWFVTGKDAYRARAEALISAFAGEISRNFFPLPTLLNSNLLLQHGTQIAIIGEDSDPGLAALLEAVYGVSLPDRIVTVAAPGETLPETHPAFGKTAVGGKATAYVCVGTVCSLPITEPDQLIAALKASRVIASAEPMSEAVNGGAS